jgi:iron complex transport system permease protein
VSALPARRVTVRTRALSARVDLRTVAVLGILAVLTLALLTAHVALGETKIPPLDVLRTLAGTGDPGTDFVVNELRLPRALVAILAGAALGIAGLIFQDVARNPLVSPEIVGISGGASLAAVSVVVFTSWGGAATLPLAALGGGLLTGLLLYVLAWRGGVQGYRLVLVGIGVAAALNACVSYVLTKGEIINVSEAWIWLVGSLNGRTWDHVWPVVIALAVLVPAALALGRQLEALKLGDELARGLGVSVERSRLALLTVAIVLTSVSVAAAGALAFVAFVAAHIARRLVPGAPSSATLPIAALCGALIVLAADLAGRELFGSTDLPAGLLTATLAAPYFLFLLKRPTRR